MYCANFIVTIPNNRIPQAGMVYVVHICALAVFKSVGAALFYADGIAIILHRQKMQLRVYALHYTMHLVVGVNKFCLAICRQLAQLLILCIGQVHFCYPWPAYQHAVRLRFGYVPGHILRKRFTKRCQRVGWCCATWCLVYMWRRCRCGSATPCTPCMYGAPL